MSTAGATPRPRDDRPPWEVPGLPAGLTDTDFATARQIAAALTDTRTAGHTLEPARGPWARYTRLAGPPTRTTRRACVPCTINHR